MRPLLLALLATLTTPAVAAEVTDMPLELQGTLDLTYAGFAEWGAIEENGEHVSQRRVLRNDLDWNMEFAPVEGVAVIMGLSQTPGLVYSYPDARQMLFEPVGRGGTYLLSDDEVGDTVKGGGVNGIWLGAAFSPFNERYKRGQRSTWRLDLAFRTGSPKKNLWVAKNGKRGSAPGGTAIRASGAVSQKMGTGNPWAKVLVQKENAIKNVDFVDEEGTSWAKNMEIMPASKFEITSGVEVVAVDEPEQGTRFAMDFFLGFGYLTSESVTSGVYLPNVIDNGKSIAMSVGDQTYALAGIAADYHINEYVRARTGPDFRFHTPFTPEHAYRGITTSADHIGVGWMFRIEGQLQAQTSDAVSNMEGTIEDGIDVLE